MRSVKGCVEYDPRIRSDGNCWPATDSGWADPGASGADAEREMKKQGINLWLAIAIIVIVVVIFACLLVRIYYLCGG